MAERQPIDAIRLLREQWSSPVALAQEMYAILTARDRAKLEGPDEPEPPSPAQEALREQRQSTFAPDLSASYTVNPVQVGEVGRKRRANEADLARFRPPEFSVAEAARADRTRFDQPVFDVPEFGPDPIKDKDKLPLALGFPPLPAFGSFPPFPAFPEFPELPPFQPLPPVGLPTFAPLPGVLPTAFGPPQPLSPKQSTPGIAFGPVGFGPGGSVINSFGSNGGNVVSVQNPASPSPLGIVRSGSGHTYQVDLYGDGIREEKTDTVSVYVLQIADGEAIPAGTVVGPVTKSSEGEYECQPPVWMGAS